ncbi:POLQ family protein [Megaselia abdita]
MEFSSFSLGNSTFMKIEKNALEKNNGLEAIEESPTKNGKKAEKTKNFSIRRKQKFQRCKSDSVLQESKKAAPVKSTESYSQFFKSDFSMKENENPNIFVNISEIQRNCEDKNDEQKEKLFQSNDGFSKILENDFKDDFEDIIDHCKDNLRNEISRMSSLSKIDFEKFTQVSEDNYIPGFTEDLDCDFEKENYVEKENNFEKENHVEQENSVEKESSSNSSSSNLTDFFDSTAPEVDENLENILTFDESSFFGTSPPVVDLQKSKKDVKTFLQESKPNVSKHAPKYLELESQNLGESRKKTLKLNLSESVSRYLEHQSENLDEAVSKIATEDLFSEEVPVENEVKVDLESLKSINAWSLPETVVREYEKKGVKRMFQWQVECLCNPKVLFDFKNLVYSAPTSAGKTLVSEILMIKTILERNKKALMILPFISVVREKMFYLSDLLSSSGYRVEGFFGGYSPPGGFESINLAICTIEKANSIINKLMEQCKLDEIGLIVVDEIHLVSDPSRGYILELLLAKALYMSERYGFQIQVVTMSATLANVQLLTKWLNAELYVTEFRPVQLQEMIKIGDKIYDKEMKVLRTITSEIPNDVDMVHQLVIETLAEGCSVVVFCPSKDWCEKLSISIAQSLHNFLKTDSELSKKVKTHLVVENLKTVKARLSDIPTGLDSVLGKAICYACSYHHAGLTTEERDIIEECFKMGFLKVIVATSTLSSGVNLPARRVIIRSPMFGGKQMNSLTYKQMIGRAGRTGQDTLGESILICTEQTSRVGIDLLTAELQPIVSCLDAGSSSHLKRALLEVISSNVVRTQDDVDKFVKCTLLNAQSALEDKHTSIKESLDFLKEYEFIRMQTDEETSEIHYTATRLGNACLSSSLPPADGLVLFSELQKSRRCFVLESELHAVYLVTPYSVSYQLQDLDWLVFLEFWEKLTPAMRKVGEIVGVSEAFLVKAMRGQSKLEDRQIKIHKRFYTALALNELVNETPINEIALKYNCNRGLLQSLQQMASTFAGIVTSFCNSLQFQNLSLILSQFKERLFFGVHRDLIDLMRLPDINYKRARALFDGGIDNLVVLANSSTLDIEKILFNSLHFETEKQNPNENEYEANKRLNERNFFITGKKGMTIQEAAKLFVEDARRFVQYEIGVDGIKWEVTQSEEQNSSRKRKSTDVSEDMPDKVLKSDNSLTLRNSNIATNDNVIKESIRPTQSKQTLDKESVKPVVSPKIINKNVPKMSSNLSSMPDLSEESAKSVSKPLSNLTKQTLSKECLQSAQSVKSSNNVVPKSLSNPKKQTLSKEFEKPVPFEKSPKNSIPKPITNPTKKISSKESTTKSTSTKISHNVNASSKILKSSEEKCDKIKNNEAMKNKELLSKPVQEMMTTLKNGFQNRPTSSEKDDFFRKKSSETKVPVNNKEASKPENNSPNSVPRLNSFTPTRTTAIDYKASPKATRKEGTPVRTTPEELPNQESNDSDEDDRIMSSQNQKELQKTQCSRLLRSHRVKQKSPAALRKPSTNLIKDHIKLKLEDKFKPSANSTERYISITEGTTKDSIFREFEQKTKSSEGRMKELDGINKSETKEGNMKASEGRMKESDEISRDRKTNLEGRSKNSSKPSTEAERKAEPEERPKSEQSFSPLINSTKFEDHTEFSIENSVIKNPKLLNASHILSVSKQETKSSSYDRIHILDVCSNKTLFDEAAKEIQNAKTFGMSLAIERLPNKPRNLIGGNLLINQRKNEVPENQFSHHIDDESYLQGISISFGENMSLFFDLQKGNHDQSLDFFNNIFIEKEVTISLFDTKDQLKALRKACPTLYEFKCKYEDSKVANWLLQPDKSLNLLSLAQLFSPECIGLMNMFPKNKGYFSIGMDHGIGISAKIRSSIEACVTVNVLKGQVENLQRIGKGELYKFFTGLLLFKHSTLCPSVCRWCFSSSPNSDFVVVRKELLIIFILKVIFTEFPAKEIIFSINEKLNKFQKLCEALQKQVDDLKIDEDELARENEWILSKNK